MRRIIIILLLFVIISSCNYNLIVKEPEVFLDEKKMEDVLYDFAIINGYKNSKLSVFEENVVDTKEMLYKKNGIDSVIFAKNMEYYSSRPDIFEKIVNNVLKRVSAEDSLLRNKNKTIK